MSWTLLWSVLTLVVHRVLYTVPGIELELVAFKTRILSPVLFDLGRKLVERIYHSVTKEHVVVVMLCFGTTTSVV